MNIFTYGKKPKKFIIAMVILVLFNFCYPKTVNAGFGEDIGGALCKVAWWATKGIYVFLNNIFTNDENSADEYVETDENGYQTTNIRIHLTPDNIIKGRFLLFDADIFKEIEADSDYLDYVEGGEISEGKKTLRETVAGWYYSLRNLAIVALLSVLVYVGIRMILSTIAQDKAKYKIMFKDWAVALCLVVVMHYLMIGILNISTQVVNALGDGEGIDMVGNLARDITGALSEKGEKNGWTYVNPEGDLIDIGAVFAKLVVLLGIIIYSFIFAVKYLKREFTIIFLILLGPISCITYPIDKISDGKAQAFNKWFSEFLYQVIIQPFHLLLYIVLIGSAAELAEANVLYALLCFAIIIPAEKFIKEMFGFKDRLGSPLGAFASGAMASKLMSSLGKKGGSSGGSGEDNDSSSNELPPKTVKGLEFDEGNDTGAGKGVGQGNNQALEENNQSIEQQENPALESGQENQSSESNEPNNDRGFGNDDSNFDEMAAGTGAMIGYEMGNNDGSGERINIDDQLDQNAAYSNRLKMHEAMEKIKSVHNQRVSKKWGSTDYKQRWKNRGKKALAGTAKFAVRAAGTGAGAIVGGTIGMMTGKGAAGAMIGAGIGRGASNKVIKGASGAYNTAKDYRNAFRSDEGREKQALKAYKADKKQIDKAVVNFRDVHKREPSARELDNEMNDRFALSRYGLKDEKIDKSLSSYQQLMREKGMTSEQAVNQTAMASKLADKQGYKGKDYMNKKTMNEGIETYTNNFMAQGVKDRNVARKKAEEIFRQSAEIEGFKISL